MTELHYKNKDRIKRRLHLQYPTCSILLERSKGKKIHIINLISVHTINRLTKT